MKTTRRMFMGVSAAAVMGPTVQAANAAGDGVTDDTAALQAAADAGGLVELQPGTYRISKPLLFDMTRSGYSGIRGPQGAARLIMAGAGPRFASWAIIRARPIRSAFKITLGNGNGFR